MSISPLGGAGVAAAFVTVVALAGCSAGGWEPGNAAEERAFDEIVSEIDRASTGSWELRDPLLVDAESALVELSWIIDARTEGPEPVRGPGAAELLEIQSSTERVRLVVGARADVSAGGGFTVQEASAISCVTIDLPRAAEEVLVGGAECPAGFGSSEAVSVPFASLGLESSLTIENAGPRPEDRLPDDTEDRIVAALEAETSARSVENRLLAELAQDNLDVRVRADDRTEEIAVAVGATGTDDCIVVAKTADGAVERVSFDRAWAQVGETGCDPGLYFRPPL